MDRWYIYMILSFSAISCSGALVFELLGLRPSDPAAYTSVSSFFGPGAYLAWWLTASSVAIKGMIDGKEHPNGGVIGSNQNVHWEIGADLLSSIGYVVAAAIWSIVQVFRRKYADLEAGLIVLEAAADISLIHVIFTTTRISTRTVASMLAALGILCHHVSPISGLQVESTAVSHTVGTNGTRHTIFTSTTEVSSTSSPNFQLAVGVNLFLVGSTTLVWSLAEFPLQIRLRRGLTVFFLVLLWVFNDVMGTYRIIPRTEIDIVSLDQLAPLCGAILVIGWSWKAEWKTCGDFIKTRFSDISELLKAKLHR